MSESTQWASGCLSDCIVTRQCMPSGKSTGLRSRSAVAENSAGSRTMVVRKTSEAAATAGDTNQEPVNNSNMAGDTTLRRRLSNIFHRDNAEIGLRMR